MKIVISDGEGYLDEDYGSDECITIEQRTTEDGIWTKFESVNVISLTSWEASELFYYLCELKAKHPKIITSQHPLFRRVNE